MTAHRHHKRWLAQVRQTIETSPLAPLASLKGLGTHRSDHLLTVATGADGTHWFVKAFAPAAASDYLREVSCYERFAFDGVVPSLRFTDSQQMIIATDFVVGGRLGDLDATRVAAVTPQLASLYATITDPTPLSKVDNKANGSLAQNWATVAHLPSAAGLPGPMVVERILLDIPRYAIHGDFQPSNVLLGDSGPLVVDFESYGAGIPATDIAKMAYNPLLAIDDADRGPLANEMLGALEHRGVAQITPLQFAASTVLWAVSCAAYFQAVRASNPESEITAPEVVPLSTRPLELAATLWNRGH